MRVVGLQQFIGQAQTNNEIHRPRLHGDEVVRARFDQVAVISDGVNHAAPSVARIEQCQINASALLSRQFGQTVCGSETAYTTTDDHHARHFEMGELVFHVATMGNSTR